MKVVDVAALQAWITANQFDSTVTPPNPPPVTPTGTYGAIWEAAVSLDFEVFPGKLMYGFMDPLIGGNKLAALKAGDNWFRLNPSTVGKLGYVQVTVRDETQSQGCVVVILPIDDNNELVSKTLGFKGVWPYQVAMPYAQGLSPNLSVSYRWLVKVYTAVAYPTSIWYK